MLWACGLSSGLNPAVHSHAALFGLGFPLLLLLNIAFIFFWLVFPFVTFGCLLSECCCLFPIYMTIVR